jgi:hypothetical protein
MRWMRPVSRSRPCGAPSASKAPGVLEGSDGGGEDSEAGVAESGSDESHVFELPHTFASDVDGVRHVIVHAEVAAMECWSFETSMSTWAFRARDSVGPGPAELSRLRGVSPGLGCCL